MAIPYVYEKYVCNLDTLRPTLDRYGVAILPNILSPEECGIMKFGMWNWLENVTKDFKIPINRENPESWRSFRELYPKHAMLIQQWSIGHAQMIWNLRTKDQILEPFERIWNVSKEDLLVSFDGASFHFPPELTRFGWTNPNKQWLHSDQSFLRNDFECIQSWINAYDTNQGDATLTFLEGSHRYHKNFAEHFQNATSDDWHVLTEEETNWYIHTKHCPRINIKCPAGSMVFWDSRTIHSGKEPDKGRPRPNYRCVVYLCYTPRAKANNKMLQKRIEAWNDLRTTSHWPHKPKLFPKIPRTYGKPLENIKQMPRPQIADIGWRLIGYETKPNLNPNRNQPNNEI